MAISTSAASGSTVTVAVEVWIRPLASVTGTRCTRWVPASCSKRMYASSPLIKKTASLMPSLSEASSERISTFHFCSAAKRRYMS